MNDLRLYILIIGICVIAGVYLWGTLQSRKQQRHQTIQHPSSVQDEVDINITSLPDSDIDYSAALAGLNQSISQSRTDHLESTDDQILSQTTPSMPSTEYQQVEIDNEFVGIFDAEKADEQFKSEPATNVIESPAQQFITLHVITRANNVVGGFEILKATADMDMEIGTMGIFHHFGVGEMKMEKALFSMANMLEPGSFDLAKMEDFTTRGLVMFMSLPGPIDGQVVFELMLNTAYRLADLLNADVCDETRSLINEQKIDAIRKSIAL